MFINYRPEQLADAKTELDSILKSNRETIDSLLKQENRTYRNFIRPLMETDIRINEFFTPVSHVNYVNNTEETQEVYNYCMPEITKYGTETAQRKDIYDAVSAVYEAEKKTLTPEQTKVLENMLKGFRLSGVHLPQEQKARLMEINLELTQLSTDFFQNILKDTDSFEYIVTDEKDVAGIPEPDLKVARCDEGWCFTLKMPSYTAYMTYGPNREIREKLYHAFTTRAPQNAEIIEKTLKLRKEEAEILGFRRFSDLSLERKNAKSPEEVISFLTELAEKAEKQAVEEMEELKKLAQLPDTASYDTGFYAEKLRRIKCGYNEQEYRPYFEHHSVVKGLFDFTEKIFGISFVQVDVPVWHETVKVYDIYKNGEVFARIYTDMEVRKGKRDGAWMNNWQTRRINAEGRLVPATAIICGNFPHATEDSPSLLRHSDVVTLFHEMGHALHHLLSEVDEADVSGVNGVEWDVIEFPSQFYELFAFNPDVLKMFSKHWQTGEVLPDEMIARLDGVRTFMSATGMLRQIEFGLFDMTIHADAYTADEVQRILNDIRKKTTVIQPPAYNKFQHGFSHIFSGGYAAGYYSYKWAERLSCDAYGIFTEKGVFNAEVGRSFLENVLSKGGSGDMIEFFRKFAGREPDSRSLLRVNGIR
ncbi:M3 family metallopeptidase [Seleniivibrio woodruffii]|uniref:oligopeptidase A n=1 Tax=Seleniivibrio woodruffii TaxID=1078050 RepID=A0A4R1KEJ7_9BACT|nr:M3 family metallopeptidase [Seleniivibrio woodruffii]TCK62510.1 oligopeptidase A [Seleniivibrio woodruffii]TVZ37063.1 oligopeptidase A [Seleniivibrio woodruffii]